MCMKLVCALFILCLNGRIFAIVEVFVNSVSFCEVRSESHLL